MKKFLINTFALIGFVTFILLACSVDDIDSNDNNNQNEIVSTDCEVDVSLQNNYGKYQVSSNLADNEIVVLNTETGVMKAYYLTSNNWVEYGNPITFTH
jgi:hypothetical protein